MNTIVGYAHIRKPLEVSRNPGTNIPRIIIRGSFTIFFHEIAPLEKLHLDIGILLANMKRESENVEEKS